jgi:hypothetical protein
MNDYQNDQRVISIQVALKNKILSRIKSTPIQNSEIIENVDFTNIPKNKSRAGKLLMLKCSQESIKKHISMINMQRVKNKSSDLVDRV